MRPLGKRLMVVMVERQPTGWVLPGIYARYVPYRPSNKRPDPRLWLGCENAKTWRSWMR